MRIIECEQGTPEWHAARAGVCTASRFADARDRTGGLTSQQAAYVDAVKAGQAPAQAAKTAGYKAPPSAQAVDAALRGESVRAWTRTAIRYATKLAIERISGAPIDEGATITPAMARGTELEDEARMLYQRRTGRFVTERGLLLTDDGRFGYSTDGWIEDEPGGIEIKTPSAPEKVAGIWCSPQDTAAEYMDQIVGGMWVTGWQWIDLVVYTPWLASIGKDMFILRVQREDTAIAALEADLIGPGAFLGLTDGIESALRAQPNHSQGDRA